MPMPSIGDLTSAPNASCKFIPQERKMRFRPRRLRWKIFGLCHGLGTRLAFHARLLAERFPTALLARQGCLVLEDRNPEGSRGRKALRTLVSHSFWQGRNVISTNSRLVILIALCALSWSGIGSVAWAATSDSGATTCLSEAEIRSLLADHPLIEFDPSEGMPCTREETLAYVAILEAIHRHFPNEISSSEPQSGGGAAGSSDRRSFTCPNLVIPTLYSLRHSIRASESRGELRPERSTQRVTVRNHGNTTVTLVTLVGLYPPARIAAAGVIQAYGAAQVLVRLKRVRPDGYVVSRWGSSQLNSIRLKARYEVHIGIEDTGINLRIRNLRNACTVFPFA